MTEQEIIVKVNQILINDFELSPEKITPEANLREELGLDSLDGVDLVVALEKTFQIKIEETEARQIDTVGRIYKQILEKKKDH
jgi:acyl carrier protein